MSPRQRFSRRAALAALLAVVSGCDGNGPTTPDGRGQPVDLSFALTLQAQQGGGEAAAFDKVTAMHIRLAPVGGAALFERTTPFDPQAETRVPIPVLIQGETQATLDVTLLRNTDPLFRGNASLTLVPNDVAVADLTLVPVGAAISVPNSLEPLTSIGETRTLPGDVLFITGDVAESLHLNWESLTPQVVSVQGSGGATSVVAVAPGEGQLQASYSSFSSLVQVLVEVVAASVDVTPATSTIDVGASVQLSFVAKDGLGHPISGSTATWSSSDEAIATVDQNGTVTGHRGGTATISATVEQAVGTATVDVVAPPPAVTTGPAQPVGVAYATLNSQVNPNQTPTAAWFEWGTDATLSSPTETPHMDVGSGTTPQAVSDDVQGLQTTTTYYFRAVAANDGGTQKGAILSFTTLAPTPPTVQVLPASQIGSTTATLRGTVDANGAPTTRWFEWGTDPTMGKFASTAVVDAGAGVDPVDVQEQVGGLTPDGAVIYYFRVAAQNSAGLVRSSIESFQTAPAAPTGLSGGFDGDLYLYWTNNSATATYFLIERSATGSTFTSIGTSPASYSGYQDGGPFPGPTAYYQVRACNPIGCSGPSNVFAVDTRPSVYGTVYLCYSSGTPCYNYINGATVNLIGPAPSTTVVGTAVSGSGYGYGEFSFDYLPATGTYTVEVLGVKCLRQNPQTVSVDWAGYAYLYFYADTACAASVPLGASNGFDPVIAGLLGVDTQSTALAAPAPR